MITALSRKKTIIALTFYWVALFIISHIPIPQVVYLARVSDKTLHFVAYLILTFLLWFATGPDKKTNWRRAAVWWVLFIIFIYAALDEWTQGLVGRSCDLLDIIADMAGVFAGLVLFSFLSFWPAFLCVTAVTIFCITNVARANISELMPLINLSFHLLAYAIFTFVWLQCLKLFSLLKQKHIKALITQLALPLALLAVVKSYSAISGRFFALLDIIIAVAAIVIAVAVNSLIAHFRSNS